MSDDILDSGMAKTPPPKLTKEEKLRLGWIKAWRSCWQDWTAEKPTWFFAWQWLLAHALWEDNGHLKRGQLEGSARDWAEIWHMEKTAVNEFLLRCEKDNKIVRQLGKGGRPTLTRTVNGTVGRTVNTVITIVNYDIYQGDIKDVRTDARTVNPAAEDLTLVLKRSIKNKSTSQSPSAQSTDPVSSEKSKSKTKRGSSEEEDSVEAEKALRSLDLEPYRLKYPHLNIDRELEGCCRHHLAIPAHYHGAKKYTKWNLVFHTWCNAEWKKPKTEDDDLSPEARKLREKYGPRS